MLHFLSRGIPFLLLRLTPLLVVQLLLPQRTAATAALTRSSGQSRYLSVAGKKVKKKLTTNGPLEPHFSSP